MAEPLDLDGEDDGRAERDDAWDSTPTDPHAVAKARDAYASLPRDPVTGRPVIG